MKFRLLRKVASKNQKGTMACILILVFLAAVFGFSSLYLYQSGQESVAAEMESLGFGDFTAWVSGQPEELVSERESVADVGKAVSQPLIFAGYEIKGEYSDDEGQLLVYDGNIPYRFRDGQGEQVTVESVKKGEVYISPAMRSAFAIDIGDTIRFELTRKNEYKDFVVAGYFEDAFMGSSMIDMKSFLISSGDRADIEEALRSASAGGVLARSGAMIHIYGDSSSGSSDRELQRSVLIGMAMEGYSRIGDITGYIWCYHYILEDGSVRDTVMKYLQEHYQGVDVHTNSWSGLDGIVSLMHLLIVVIYVLAAVFILITVSLATGRLLRSEAGNMAVYKSMGISSGRLKRSFALRFLLVVLAGSLAGAVVAGMGADRVIAGIFKNFGIAEFSSLVWTNTAGQKSCLQTGISCPFPNISMRTL